MNRFRGRISIGPDGSSSRALSLELLGRARLIDPKSAPLLALTPAGSAQALLHGEINVAVFLDGWESPAVQQLLKTNYIHLGTNSKDFIERLDRLEDRTSRLSVPWAFRPLVYGLRLHIDMVRNEAQKSILP